MHDEYISREAMLEHLDRCKQSEDATTLTAAVITALQCFVQSQPAADVAPVVRCKDCKHRTEYGNCGHPRQKGVLPSAYPFDFCSYGKPKKGK